MVLKVFVLGRPGSGKSTCARYIEMGVRDSRKECLVYRVCDYDILCEMSKSAEYRGMFSPTQEYEGFDVRDLNAFDLALKKLERQVEEWTEKVLASQSSKERLAIIEFARDDYANAFNQFNKEFLRDAYFLFLDVDVPTCIQRIRQRTAYPMTEDDHFVSEYIFDVYYHKDDKQFMTSELLRDYGVDGNRVLIIGNGGSPDILVQNFNHFIPVICSAIDSLPLRVQHFSDEHIDHPLLSLSLIEILPPYDISPVYATAL